jgi:hypothetical protein
MENRNAGLLRHQVNNPADYYYPDLRMRKHYFPGNSIFFSGGAIDIMPSVRRVANI